MNVNLANATGHTGGHAAGDRLDSFDHLIGSGHGDTLTGDSDDNFIDGLAGADTLYGASGADTLEGGAGDDTLYGGSGSDLFIFQEGSDDQVYGGTGASWTDSVHLDGAAGGSPGTYGVDWTISLTSGSITDTQADHLDLSQDAAGTITLQDGSQVTFEGIERIEW
ncbi:MAG: hypothetical protein MI920_13345 [Kiloniellales bacterium]|nr:hypothetical protein [Kiloniellales bacterium]